jgi:hypothetical protein
MPYHNGGGGEIRVPLPERTRPAAVCFALCFLAASAALQAHHSLTGIYDRDVTVTIEGRVAQFHFVNPHPYVMVQVDGGDGTLAGWRLDMDNRRELEAIGMTATTLAPGDRITATGMRGRDNAARLYVRRLERPSDGFWYEQVGSSPRIGRQR